MAGLKVFVSGLVDLILKRWMVWKVSEGEDFVVL